MKKGLTKQGVRNIIIGHLRARRLQARELKYFFGKLKKVLDLSEKVCYSIQAVTVGSVKDRDAECTL